MQTPEIKKIQTGNQNIAVFSEPMHITEDVHCCLKVASVIAKEGIYDFPTGPAGETEKWLWSRPELLKAAKLARIKPPAITIYDHPESKIVTSQDEVYGTAESCFFDRDKIRATLNYDKALTPPEFLEGVHKASARKGPPKDVSIGFYYVEDRTPGVWRGYSYDGIMRNIVIDHVATDVAKGRCSWPNCGIGVSSVQMAAFLKSQSSRASNIMEVKKQVSEEQKPESDINDFDEHGCKIGVEKWDGEKCVPTEEKAEDGDSEGDVSKEGRASEGVAPEQGEAIPPVPDDGKKDVDEHGCYPDETWSDEQQLCVPNRDPTDEVVGEDKPGESGESTQPESASVLIERANALLRLKSDRDIERLRAERRHPA